MIKKPKKKFERKSSFKKKLVVTLFVILGVLALGVGITDVVVRSVTFSKGYRVGTIVKLTHKGYIFKTWEGQLHLGGVDADGEGGFSPFWDFSVYQGDKDILQAINVASDKKQTVKLYYKEKLFRLFWRGDTKYFVYKVEDVEEKPK